MYEIPPKVSAAVHHINIVNLVEENTSQNDTRRKVHCHIFGYKSANARIHIASIHKIHVIYACAM